MTEIAQPSQNPPAVAAKNPFQRIAGVLFAPAETFQDIARKPDIIVPLLVLIVISYINTAVLVPRMDFEAAVRTQMENSGRQMSGSEMDQAARMGAAFGKVMAWTGPLWAIVIYLIVAGVLLLAFRLFGGEGNFKQALSTVIYSSYPWAIAAIVMAIVAFTKTSIDPTQMATLVKSNPAFLVDMKEQPVLFSALSSLDIFTIWALILYIIGFSTFTKTSRGKAAAIIISLWLVMVVVKVGFAAMGAARMKA